MAHEKELHLVVVSRDLGTYAHVHPERDAAGTWTVTAPALPPGSYRVYADFVPTGHDGLTLATDLAVAGAFSPQPLPAPGSTAEVDGYDVTIDGELVAGADSTITVTVHRDGRRSPTSSRTSAPSATWSPSATATSPTSTCTRSTPSTVPAARPSASPSMSPPPARTACSSTSPTAGRSTRRA